MASARGSRDGETAKRWRPSRRSHTESGIPDHTCSHSRAPPRAAPAGAAAATSAGGPPAAGCAPIARGSADQLLLQLEIVLEKGGDRGVDAVLVGKAERLGPRRGERLRPAADNGLDRGVVLPANAGIGGLAAGAPHRRGNRSDRLAPKASPGSARAWIRAATTRRGEASAMTVSGATGQTAS